MKKNEAGSAAVMAHRRVLVSIAGSKPTAFQAVGFKRPVPRYENRRNGGIQAKRARGLRFEVPHDVVHEISEEDIT
jgi:hypothetical protein